MYGRKLKLWLAQQYFLFVIKQEGTISIGIEAKEFVKKSHFAEHSLMITDLASAEYEGSVIIYSASLDGTVVKTTMSNDKNTCSAKFNILTVDSFCLSADPLNRHFATGSHAGSVMFWNTLDGSLIGSVETGGKFILSIQHSKNGRYVAVGCEEGNVFVIEIESMKLLYSFKDHFSNCRSVAFSADSEILFSAGDDKRVLIYEMESGFMIGSIAAHEGPILCISSCPKFDQIATCSMDNKIKIWDWKARECLFSFEEASQPWAIDYNREGNRLAAVFDNSDMIVYSV